MKKQYFVTFEDNGTIKKSRIFAESKEDAYWFYMDSMQNKYTIKAEEVKKGKNGVNYET